MKIGKYKLTAIETGTFALDGGAMFGIIPKTLWERTNPADEKNRITLGGRCLLLQSENRNILIDTGIGNGWDEKFSKIYNLDFTNSFLMKSLNNCGIQRDNITDVILTHLHFDHTGGAVVFNNGKPEPAFPNAKYYIQQKHFEWAKNPSFKDSGSFITNRFLPLAEEGVLKLTDENFKLDDEISFVVSNGHTFSQQLVKISDGNNTLLYCGDLFPTSSHIPIPYVMGYDLQPVKTIEEKLAILPKAVDEDWLLFFEHDPYFTAGKIMKTDKGFKIGERTNVLQ